MRRLTRRNLFAAVGAAPLAAAAVTQETMPAPASSKEEDLKTARELMATNAAQLAKVKVPIATEPAFVFKA